MTRDEVKKAHEELYAVIGGPKGLNCAGSCAVDGHCICTPAYEAIRVLKAIEAQLSAND